MKTHITREDKEEFKKTKNGKKKVVWMIVGMLLDFLATLGISLLHIYMDKLDNTCFLIILFVLLVIVVLGGELIGVYYGAMEQYIFEKNKKVIETNE